MDAFSQAVPFPSDGMQGSGTKISAAAWLVYIAPEQARCSCGSQLSSSLLLADNVQQVALAASETNKEANMIRVTAKSESSTGITLCVATLLASLLN